MPCVVSAVLGCLGRCSLQPLTPLQHQFEASCVLIRFDSTDREDNKDEVLRVRVATQGGSDEECRHSLHTSAVWVRGSRDTEQVCGDVAASFITRLPGCADGVA
jgi:hypothetical protein